MPSPQVLVVAAALVAAAGGGCGSGDPNAPGRNLREDDQRWAEGALPRAEILPDGWSGTADDRGAALDDCEAVDRSNLTLTGEAVASFEHGERLLAIAGTQIFDTEEDARALVEAPSDADLAACLVEELAETFADDEAGERLERLEVEAAPAPASGENARAATAEGVFVAGETRAPARFEVVWAQRDRAALTLVTATLAGDFPAEAREELLADFDERTREKPPP